MRLAAFTLFLAAGAFAQDDPWVFVHPKATFIAGVGWQSAKNSEFVQILRRDVSGKTTGSGELDFVDRLDFALLSVPAPNGAPAGGVGKSMLAVLRGKFDLVKLHSMAGKEGARAQTYNDVELLSPSKDDTAVVAIVDPMTLLVGDRQSVTLAIRERFRANNNSELVQRALAMSEKATAWLVFDAPADIGTSTPMLQGLKRVGLGITLHRNAELVADLEAQDAQHAAAFAAATQMMMNTQNVRMGALKVESAGNSVRMSTSITPEQVKAGAQKFGQNMAQSVDLGGLGGLLGVQRKGTAAPVQEAPLPPEKNVIRIYGLEGGVREIQVEPK